jgi:predicted PurR-regulated permease PerM
MEGKILDVTWGTVFKFFLAGLIIYFAFVIKDILILFIFALIISLLFAPAIDFLVRRRIPRVLAIILIYLFIFGIIGLLIYLIAPIFIGEIENFSDSFHNYFDKLAPIIKSFGGPAFENFDSFTKSLQDWLGMASSGILSAAAAIFGSIFSTFTIFSLSIFLSFEEKGVEKTLALLFPKKYEDQVLYFWQKSRSRVSGWFGSRILASIFITVMLFIACKVLGIKYAIFFSLLAGVTNIIPIIGPLVAGVIIVALTLLDSWTKALFILAAFFLIQQIEGNFLTPFLTKKFIGMPPVLVLLAILVGGKLWGVLGAILAIPLFGILFEFLKDFLKKQRDEKPVAM